MECNICIYWTPETGCKHREPQRRFFTVNHAAAMKAGEFSALVMNVPNTAETRAKAAEFYPEDVYLIEYHDFKKPTSWIIPKN